MRGVEPIPVPVPRGGWQTWRPPNELPPDALSDGLNVMLTEDGLLTPRLGYERLPFQVPILPQEQALDHRIAAGVSWQDEASANLIVATLTRWWVLTGTGFVDITGDDDPQSSDANTPVRLVQFGQATLSAGVNPAPVTGEAVYGINGSQHDLMHVWVNADPPPLYEPVIDNAHGGFSFAASDMAIVGDRLVVIDTTEGGVAHSRRVRWSSVLDGQSWPPLAFSDREGLGNLIAIRTTSRTSAIIYAEKGAWIMSAQPGTDAGAFAFDILQGITTPPTNPNAIISYGSLHTYMSQDKRFRECNGQSGDIISEPINAGLKQHLASFPNQKPVGLYDETDQRLIFFVTFTPDEEAYNAISYNLFTRSWEPPWRFFDAITAAFPVIELMGPTWDNPGVDANGNTFTWDTAPWASWNAIPENFVPATYIGTKDGMLARFFAAASDNGNSIPFLAQWGLRTPQDAGDRLEINTVEVYLQPVDTLELLRFVLTGLRTPFDSTQIPILDQKIDQTNPPAWIIRLDPARPAQGAFRESNLFQVVLSGRTVQQAPRYGGGVLYAFVKRRPDPALATSPMP